LGFEQIKKYRAVLYSNFSAALLAHGQPLAALIDAKRAIELDP